jgi:hypothetical protein
MGVFMDMNKQISTLSQNSLTNTIALGTLIDMLISKGLFTKEEFQAMASVSTDKLQKQMDDQMKAAAQKKASSLILPS